MNREEKIAHLVADLKARGLSERTAIPPIVRLLWQMGFDVSPPCFWNPVLTSVCAAGVLGVVSAASSAYVDVVSGDNVRTSGVVWGAIVGVVLGVALAAGWTQHTFYYSGPTWRDYPQD